MIQRLASVSDIPLSTKQQSISFPSRGAHNQLYVPELERFVLKRACPTRSHLSEEAAKDKVSFTLAILRLILKLFSNNCHVTKREVYYSTARKFGNQEYSDTILDDILQQKRTRYPCEHDRVRDMQSDGLFILVVEKHATFDRLKEDRFYERFPCIIVTGKGQPDVGTRQFLRKMKMELKLPVFALVDCDPHGLRIFSVYRHKIFIPW
ncbi:endodeoxyribonuclease [Orobanche hederae]